MCVYIHKPIIICLKEALPNKICLYQSIFACVQAVFLMCFANRKNCLTALLSYKRVNGLKCFYLFPFSSLYFFPICLSRLTIIEISKKTSPQSVYPFCLSFFALNHIPVNHRRFLFLQIYSFLLIYKRL